jgi:hypothetical protein
MLFINEARLGSELKSKGVSRKGAKESKPKFLLYVFLCDFAALRENRF